MAHWVPILQGEAPEGTVWGAQAQLSPPADQVFSQCGEADLLSLPDSQERATGVIKATATKCRCARACLSICFLDVAIGGCRHKSMLSWVIVVLEREDRGQKSALAGGGWASQQQLLGICQSKEWGSSWRRQGGWDLHCGPISSFWVLKVPLPPLLSV